MEVQTNFDEVDKKSSEANYMRVLDGRDQEPIEFVTIQQGPNAIIQAKPVLKVKRLTEDAVLPTRGSAEAACWDVYAAEDVIVCGYFHSGDYNYASECQVVSVSTGLAFEIPKEYRMSVRPRSGLAFKQGITVVNAPGTVDSDYRGELRIGLVMLTPGKYQVKKGDRIAQICLEKVEEFVMTEVDELEDTERGDGAFGSTGK